MRIRKQAYELTAKDFEEFPVWESALDEEGQEGQDEATVRPHSGGNVADPSDGTLLVKSSFQLADGTAMTGWLTPPFGEYTGLSTIQPVILTDDGPVWLYNGTVKPTAAELAESYRRLGRNASKTFPLTFNSDPELLGGPVSGTVSGFSYLAMETDEVRIVT